MANGLRRLDGVADVEVDLQRNLCTLIPQPDRTLPLAAVAEAVRQAGFRPGRVFLRASGQAERAADGGTLFRIDGWPEPLPLTGPAPTDGELTAAYVEAPTPHLVPTAWPDGS